MMGKDKKNEFGKRQDHDDHEDETSVEVVYWLRCLLGLAVFKMDLLA